MEWCGWFLTGWSFFLFFEGSGGEPPPDSFKVAQVGPQDYKVFLGFYSGLHCQIKEITPGVTN